jgi:DNA helicase-2/ATP-dependent DNA helicase PcrA
VLRGDIHPRHALAVTFTARAASEMRDRLGRLGVAGVQARTFHSAALRQVRYFAARLFSGHELPELIESKVRLVGLAAARAGVSTDRTAVRDLAGEIEWAKSSLVEPGEYPAAAAKSARDTPLDPERVAAVYEGYELAKRSGGVIDFEDLLRAAVWGIEEHSDVAEQVHAQYRHFVVDEYQDVNPLQQRLLDAWLGGRDDLTVVGDASQTIYSFTGASSSHLVDFPRRYAGATVFTRDYRSTPQVVALANTVIAQASGELSKLRLELVGQRPDGPAPRLETFADEPAEAAAVAARCAELISAGTPANEIAVLFRANAQSESYEEALAQAGVAYAVRGGERFFERQEIRRAMVALRAATRTISPGQPLRSAVVEALRAIGWHPDQPPPGGAAREQWEAVAALVSLVGSVSTPVDESLEAFCEELSRRAVAQHAPTVAGVTLSSLHSAKGLEWDAVFVVGLAEGTLPTGYAKSSEALEEERRLLYVGITRAREQLWLSHARARQPGGRARRACRFVPMLDSGSTPASSGRSAGRSNQRGPARVVIACRVCGAGLVNGVDRKLGRCADCPSDLDEPLLERLREWRSLVAGQQRVPAYVIFTDATLTAVAERRPATAEELIMIAGIGPRKLSRYGDAVLALVGGASAVDCCEVSPE